MLMKRVSFIFFMLTLFSATKADEIVSPVEAAQRYLNSDLVLVGKVISIEVKIVEDSVTQGDDGWQYHQPTLFDNY